MVAKVPSGTAFAIKVQGNALLWHSALKNKVITFIYMLLYGMVKEQHIWLPITTFIYMLLYGMVKEQHIWLPITTGSATVYFLF